jgi:hypothetical protein
MLLFASTLDYRINNEPDTVQAWMLVLDEGMSAEWASKFVRQHYRTTQAVLTPAVLNMAWVEFRSHRNPALGDEAHCGKQGCLCTHMDPCFKGWVPSVREGMTAPCGVCRADLVRVLGEINPAGLRNDGDFARLRNRTKDVGM